MERESSTAGQSLGPNAGRVAGSGSQQQPAAVLSTDVAAGATGSATAAAKSGAAMHDPAAAPHAHFSFRRAVFIAVAVVVIAAAAYFGVPIVNRALNTVSTDDAYVNGHYTLVAARVPGQVLRDGVLVNDNYRVRKGDVLVRFDPQPYQVIVYAEQAAYDLAKANLVVAQDEFRGLISKARSARFQLDHAIEDVDNQVCCCGPTWRSSAKRTPTTSERSICKRRPA